MNASHISVLVQCYIYLNVHIIFYKDKGVGVESVSETNQKDI